MIETPLTAEPSLIDFYPDFYTEPKSQPKEIKADNLEFTKCRRFGISYMGSKNQIVKALISQLPSAKYFIDLFAGGCAMTHGAMLSGKYERFIANDISEAPSLFQRAINGEFRDEKRWISRDDFFALKDSDPYVRILWSFNNNCERYLYGKKIENYKKAQHYKEILGDNSLMKDFKNFDFYEYSDATIKTCEQKRRLARLNNCIGLELNSLQITQKSYKEVELPEPSECVIYCDPPYKGTAGYLEREKNKILGIKGKMRDITSFNHDEFYDWCIEKAKQGYKVFISEYDMPRDRFKSVFFVEKRLQLHHLGAGKLKQEHLFVPII